MTCYSTPPKLLMQIEDRVSCCTHVCKLLVVVHFNYYNHQQQGSFEGHPNCFGVTWCLYPANLSSYLRKKFQVFIYRLEELLESALLGSACIL